MGGILIKDKKQTELATVPPNEGGTIAASHLEIFGPPPLLDGESQEVYDALLARVTGTVSPKDIIEEIWVHDIVDLVWEILRLRRLKVALLSSSVGRGLQKLYYDRDEKYGMDSLIARWSAREPVAVKKVEQFLKDHGLTMDAVMAHSFVACLDEIERIDIAISRAEARRNAAQREIERRRSFFGQMLQRAVQQIEHDAVVPVEGVG
jgi:hypothetical protein